MPEATEAALKTTERKRAPQKRAEETRQALLDAATQLFSGMGYEGVSVRTIEAHADVKRGLVAYHFSTKENLWKEAITLLLEKLATAMTGIDGVVDNLPQEARFRAAATAFMRYSAEFPELNRIMVQEAKAKSWRSDYMLDSFIEPLVEWLNRLAGQKIDVHTHYIIIGAATFVFNVEYECERLFGVNPRNAGFADDHANAVMDLLAGHGSPLLEGAQNAK